MKNTQYAVCHMQKGSGNDSGMSCHIERRDAKGKLYVPDNADSKRTHLNRELVTFPQGVSCRTEAIQHRIDNAGLKRKVGKNQVKVIRIILSGTHERMVELERQGKLDQWINANLRWLRDTFGKDNVVSCVLHMDEKTPHIHASVVPIVTAERKRREREGGKKYQTDSGPRLCCDEVMSRGRMKQYQDSYAQAMKPFGLQRGVVGSTARHQSNGQWYRQQMLGMEENIERLQKEVEAANEGRNRILSWIGKGELAEAKNQLKAKDKEIAELKKQLSDAVRAKSDLEQKHQAELAKVKNGYQREISVAIARAEKAERQRDENAETIGRQRQLIAKLDRKANPERYRLSSGAQLENFKFLGNYGFVSSMMIWTKVGDVENRATSHHVNPAYLRDYQSGNLTIEELVNCIFKPWEQINESQATLLGTTLELLSGGPASTHIGTGSGGDTSNQSRWDGKKTDEYKSGGNRRKR